MAAQFLVVLPGQSTFSPGQVRGPGGLLGVYFVPAGGFQDITQDLRLELNREYGETMIISKFRGPRTSVGQQRWCE